jgi:protocatechuate 3,4-dioxygenase beta subunit
MRKIAVIFSCFLCVQCSVDRTILTISKTETITLAEFQKLDSMSTLFITDDEEPGEKLILCLTFIDVDSKKIVSNQRVSFYHTATDGEYEPSNPNDETTARLNGTTKTDEAGNIYVKTILPGDYGSAENNRHIHTTVYGARPEAYDIFFKQYSSRMGTLMNSGNNQIFFADLKKTADDILVCFVTIEAKIPKAKD